MKSAGIGHLRSATRAPAFVAMVHLVACSLTACAQRNITNVSADYPQVNPHPTQFLHFYGDIDSTLDISFKEVWRAANPACQYTASAIEGAHVAYTAEFDLPVVRQGEAFHEMIPIDGVIAGRCRWAFAGVTFSGRTGFPTQLVATNSYPLKPGQSPDGVAVLRCKWTRIPDSPEGQSGIACRWPTEEDPNKSVLGGILWWHPSAKEFEAHFIADKGN